MLKNKTQNYYNFYKFIPNKITTHFFYLFRKFLLIYILLISGFKLIENSEIKLIIQGEGQLNILNPQFYLDPSEVIVNGISKPSCNKSCEFNKGLNNVTIKFNVPIESCVNMFNGMNNIIEIDLFNLDTSKVINMQSMFYILCYKYESIILCLCKFKISKFIKYCYFISYFNG